YLTIESKIKKQMTSSNKSEMETLLKDVQSLLFRNERTNLPNLAALQQFFTETVMSPMSLFQSTVFTPTEDALSPTSSSRTHWHMCLVRPKMHESRVNSSLLHSLIVNVGVILNQCVLNYNRRVHPSFIDNSRGNNANTNVNNINTNANANANTNVNANHNTHDSNNNNNNLNDTDKIQSRLLAVVTQLKTGVDIRDRHYHMKKYKQCFVAQDAVQWLLQHPAVSNCANEEQSYSCAHSSKAKRQAEDDAPTFKNGTKYFYIFKDLDSFNFFFF
ncbi:transmembrane protein, partial [Reticulomyxa filosa]